MLEQLGIENLSNINKSIKNGNNQGREALISVESKEHESDSEKREEEEQKTTDDFPTDVKKIAVHHVN